MVDQSVDCWFELERLLAREVAGDPFVAYCSNEADASFEWLGYCSDWGFFEALIFDSGQIESINFLWGEDEID